MAGYNFNLPSITLLTVPQQSAVNQSGPIALSGGPGTGKSVVSIYRHLSNLGKDHSSLLLTYTTTLAIYLKRCCSIGNPNVSECVRTSLKGKPKSNEFYDEIIVDEAQDLPIEYYYYIKNRATSVSYGADDAQILYPEKSSSENDLYSIFSDSKKCLLDRNFRSTLSIMKLAKAVFQEAYIPQQTLNRLSGNIGELPVMLISGGSKYDKENIKQDNAILKIIESYNTDNVNIAILLPWKKQVKDFYDRISKDITCSRYYQDEYVFPSGCEDISNVHITTFKSSKGLEFDTVIIPNFDKLLDVSSMPSHLHLDWKDYFVGVTRARSNLYVICNNEIPHLDSLTEKEFL
ncbi:MAG: 3'-5' exonuclease [Marinifilaceae bacterium]